MVLGRKRLLIIYEKQIITWSATSSVFDKYSLGIDILQFFNCVIT